MSTTAPKTRTVCQLTGEISKRPSAFFAALNEATRRATDSELIRDAFARAVGYYSCPCGDAFEFADGMGIEDYAALNRWLAHHFDPCATLQAAENARLKTRVEELEAELENQTDAFVEAVAKACGADS